MQVDDGRQRLADDPILIFGAPRSGTTYLRQLLDAHPEVVMSNELRVFTWLHQALAVLPRSDLNLLNGSEDFVAVLRRGLPELLRDYYAGLSPTARWWGDKNPHYADDPAVLRFAAELFPVARFVHIHRDPRAVVASLLRKRHGDGSTWINLEDAHQMVVGHVRHALAFEAELGWQRVRRVRYETLVGDDLGEARRLFDWLGIPMHEAVEIFCRQQGAGRTEFSGPTSDLARAGSREASREAWLAVVPREHWRDSLQFLAPVLLELGYEDAASLDAENRAIPA